MSVTTESSRGDRSATHDQQSSSGGERKKQGGGDPDKDRADPLAALPPEERKVAREVISMLDALIAMTVSLEKAAKGIRDVHRRNKVMSLVRAAKEELKAAKTEFMTAVAGGAVGLAGAGMGLKGTAKSSGGGARTAASSGGRASALRNTVSDRLTAARDAIGGHLERARSYLRKIPGLSNLGRGGSADGGSASRSDRVRSDRGRAWSEAGSATSGMFVAGGRYAGARGKEEADLLRVGAEKMQALIDDAAAAIDKFLKTGDKAMDAEQGMQRSSHESSRGIIGNV